MDNGSQAAGAGMGFGAALAITISWSANHSILWAIVPRALFVGVRALLCDNSIGESAASHVD